MVVVVVVALGFLLAKGLAGATTYFYTADQAVHMRPQLGDTRFRIEGTVVRGTVRRAGDRVDFSIANNGVQVAVDNTGYPPQLFQPGIPVVLEGQFQGATFVSDLIMVKHTSTYTAAHPQRVSNYVGKNGTRRTGTGP
jgi:cytochrome c-type biogenesis protein CcmE